MSRENLVEPKDPRLALPQSRLDDLLAELQTRLQTVTATRDRVYTLLDGVVAVGTNLDLEVVLKQIVGAAITLVRARYGALGIVGKIPTPMLLLGLVALGGSVIAKIPLAALAAVTAYVGFGLLEWSTWKRLTRMRRLDALAFLSTAVSVLATNAVFAVAIGCSFYVFDWALHRLRGAESLPVPADKAA